MEGKWNFTVHTFMGDMRSVYELKVVGDKIEGTATDASNGATAPVDNGTFDGTNFSWDMTIKTAVGEMTNHLTGTFEEPGSITKQKGRSSKMICCYPRKGDEE